MRMIEMDKTVGIRDQLGDSGGPVILVNSFTVEAGETEQLMAAWAEDAAYFQRQPGFVSAQLHRGIAGSCVFLNYAVWQSVQDFRAAFTNPEFQGKLAHYPASTVAAPHLFRKLAVPGICGA
ncbi:Heme-degrading monooxygenase HmoA [Rhizobiales bacterium GAS191]|jgi:heme-degrading monooxygenase HmoA|nr:Heme-degrading monooxygenase HmoA [Rhizobiales bacterium GAS113]SEE10436.1 Heme-degrading monooxygenase HmoA [Rhizobiales bacterium GAS188]SEE46069.1 Heme-degrading monooxygenase HmoA [Rhizobiales bacterium GAS191]